ncbi:MAG: hypothetical protein R6V32_05865 [Bacteroidales bacterium]
MRITIKHCLLAAFLLILASACKKLPVYECEYTETPGDIKKSDGALPYAHYDSESKIRYDIYHNDSSLFLYFDVSDQTSIFKIFAYGLEVYIDKTGKRNKKEGFIYPIAGAVNQGAVLEPQGMKPALPDKSRLSDLQKNISREFTLIQDDKEENFNLFALHNDLEIEMNFNDNDNLQYKAAIPLKMFGIDSLPETLTIGILSGEMPGPEEMEDQDVNMQNSAYNRNPITQNSPVSGNMPGRRTPQGNQNQTTNTPEPIRIWFKIKPVMQNSGN